MLTGFLVLFITGSLWGVLGVVISRMKGSGHEFTACRALSSCFGVIVAWSLIPKYSELSAPSQSWGPIAWIVGLMFCGEVLRTSGLLLVQRAMKGGHNGQAWMIAQAAFMIPFLAGVFVFGEMLGLWRGVGIFVCLASVFVLGKMRRGKEEPGGGEGSNGNEASLWRLFAVLAFAVFGVQQTLMTVPSHWNMDAGVMSLRVPVLQTWALLINASIMIRKKAWPTRNAAVSAMWLSASGLVSMFLFYYGLDLLAELHMVSLAYPVTVAACIVSFTLYSAIHLRESFGLRHAVGLAGIMLSLVCFAVSRM